ncbi:MAG TPA: YlqF/YawG family GTPase, partial [Massilibacterium sp.]|nr:YlqF/YawG family GTPase [Massilibacterium sp.]
LIVGIPNSGKSTLINRMAKKNIAKTGNRPGVTTQQQWIKVGKDFELLDTPGILWPKFEDESVGLRLAATGAIKDQLLDFTDIATFLLTYYKKEYPDRLKERYDLKELPEDIVLLYEEIGKRRGCFIRKNEIDYEKVAELLIRETRNGQLGRLSFEKPE